MQSQEENKTIQTTKQNEYESGTLIENQTSQIFIINNADEEFKDAQELKYSGHNSPLASNFTDIFSGLNDPNRKQSLQKFRGGFNKLKGAEYIYTQNSVNSNDFKLQNSVKNKKKVRQQLSRTPQKHLQQLQEKKQFRLDQQFSVNQLLQLNSSKKMKEIEKEIKKFIKHLFKYHINRNQKDAQTLNNIGKGSTFDDHRRQYKNKLLIVFYTLCIMDNIHLAYFQLIELVQSLRDSFFDKNRVYINQLYFESIMIQKDQQLQLNSNQAKVSHLNLMQMVKINQLYSELQLKLEFTTEQIQNFWQNLYTERNSVNLYIDGCNISREIDDIKRIYDLILNNAVDKSECKLYLLMASFFKFVLFKNKEAYDELVNYKQALQLRALQNKNYDIDLQGGSDKGFIITEFSFKQEMRISQISKHAGKLSQLDINQAKGLPINRLMPSIIAENHSKMITDFMRKGKSSIINTRRESYIKQRSGHIIPVYLYLIVSFQNSKQMIMMVEDNKDLYPFEENEKHFNEEHTNNTSPFGLIITDSNFKICEFSSACNHVCDLNMHVFNHLTHQNNLALSLENLFVSANETIVDIQQSLMQNPNQIFDVIPLYESIVQRILDENEEQRQKYFPHKMNQRNVYINDIYLMRMWIDRFQNSGTSMYVFAIQKSAQNISSMMIPSLMPFESQPYGPNQSLSATQARAIQSHNMLESEKKSGKQSDSQNYNHSSVNQSSNEQHQIDFNSVSTTNTSTSQVSSEFFSFQKFASDNKDLKLPATIKIIFQIIIVVSALIVITSVVDLVLTFQNIQDAKDSIDIGSISYSRLNSLRGIRPCIRSLVNMANGFQEFDSPIIPNRFEYFLNQAEILLTEVKDHTTQLNQKSVVPDNKYMVWSINSQNKMYNETLSQTLIMQMYINQVSDMLEQVKRYGMNYLKSTHELLNLFYSNMPQASANLIERQLFYVIYNQNQNVYDSARDFSSNYVIFKIKNIQSKIEFLDKINLICFGIVVACGLFIIPLVVRVNSRLQKLMKIFFNLKKTDINSMVKSIQMYMANQKKKTQGLHDKYQQRELILFQNIDLDVEKAKIEKIQANQVESQKIALDDQESSNNSQIIGEYQDEEGKEQQSFEMMRNLKKSLYQKQKHKQQKSKSKKQKRKNKKAAGSNDEDSYEEESQNDYKDKMSHQKQSDSLKDGLQKQQIQIVFQSYIRKNKTLYVTYTFLITLVLASYFLIVYFLTQSTFAQIKSNVATLQSIYQRKSAVDIAVITMLEGLSQNKTVIVNNGKAQQFPYQLTRMMEKENVYRQQVVEGSDAVLDKLKIDIKKLEGVEMCDYYYESDNLDEISYSFYNLTRSQCKTIGNGIGGLGMQNFLYQAVSEFNQENITFNYKNGAFRNREYLLSHVQGKLTELFDLGIRVFNKPQMMLEDRMLIALNDYNDSTLRSFLLLFFAFVSIIVTLLMLFLLKIFQSLKNQVIQTNKMLFIINFEESSDELKQEVNKFLSSY
eukprot:403345719